MIRFYSGLVLMVGISAIRSITSYEEPRRKPWGIFLMKKLHIGCTQIITAARDQHEQVKPFSGFFRIIIKRAV
jgi:hypothetical protein